MTLIIARRQVADFFSLTRPELNAIHQLLSPRKMAAQAFGPAVIVFNIGVNAGEVAGQASCTSLDGFDWKHQ